MDQRVPNVTHLKNDMKEKTHFFQIFNKKFREYIM
jgi:hypothetical protein